MKLAYWMYAGPAHIGTLRVASSFKNVHAIMHAPLGDDYFNVMRSMLERERDFTPVTASIVDRHVLARGSQEKVVENITRKDKEERPDLIVLTPTCTSSILQEDLQNFVERATISKSEGLMTHLAGVSRRKGEGSLETGSHLKGEAVAPRSLTGQLREEKIAVLEKDITLESDVLLADVNHYRVNEFQAADRTLEQIVRFYLEKDKKRTDYSFEKNKKTEKPSANIIGIFTLGFHNQHDCRELKRLLNDLGIQVNEIIPEGGSVKNLKNLPKAWFNIIPYREIGLMTAVLLEKEYQMPYVSITPMGLVNTAAFILEIAKILEVSFHTQMKNSSFYDEMIKSNQQTSLESIYSNYIDSQTRFVSQAAWFSRSIDCQNLTGKRAVVFGDATHSANITKILAREMGIKVACAGTYCKHDADWFREQVLGYCDQVLITDDHTQVGDMIAQIEPAAIFGTQMERHVGKRLDIPCGVISAPVHIQNFPLGYRPFLGYEGTNQIADLVYNSFSLGMEDHLLSIFGGHDTKEVITKALSTDSDCSWSTDGLAELNKIPGFVRGKVKRNTEKYARQKNISIITVEIMYAAKEAVGA
uniref:Light-independent protochlorophyllide reductase subunit B n=1 Tax=Lobochlamys segnis TaxID=52035 RepID=A0A0S2IC58_9CHLO|nr:ChlB subunit of protochlorophyllide reductase [Lobochlamys segnis]